MQQFEWDGLKAESNLRKHGISFEEAKTVLDDFGLLCATDPEHSVGEARQVAIGYSSLNHILTVCFTERDDVIRIISARKSTSFERKLYENP